MKALKKIGSFFAAIVPLAVFIVSQFVVVVLGGFVVAAVEMMESSAFIETISYESVLVIAIAANLICIFVAFMEMKIHRFGFKDISPVKQNKKVYLFAALFAIGAFFTFEFLTSIFIQITGTTDASIIHEITDEMIVLTVISYATGSFVEELVFRGLAAKTFEKRFPVWVGAIVTTIAFSLMYYEFTVCFAFLMGASLIFIRYKFGDLKLCFMVNLIMTLMLIAASLLKSEHYYGQMMTIGSVVGTIIAAGAMFLMLKNAEKAEILED